jgi:hypothetical protein
MKFQHIGLCFLTCVLLPFTVASQERETLKPAYIGVLYYLDPSAKLQPLDRQYPQPNLGFKSLGFGGDKAVVELDTERATLRLPSNQAPSFVVELASGVDPREFQLHPLKVKGGKRQLIVSSGSIFKPQIHLPLQINISAYGVNTYKITPVSNLAAGEYVFTAAGSTEMFCFGVDKRD